MRRVITLFAVGGLASLTANPAIASALDDHFARHVDPEGRAVLREFAGCKAERYPAAAQVALRADLSMVQLQIRFPDMISTPQCFKSAIFHSRRMAIGDGFYQGYLAEALLLRDYSAASLPDIARTASLPREAMPAPDETKLPDKLRTDFALVRESGAFDLVAECVARAAPVSVYRFVTGRPDTADEGNGFTALQGAITPCLTDGNLPAYPTFAWQITLARQLYRLLDAARPVPHTEATPHA